ncbi:hypothetical protein [Streptomyces sp. NPDC086989]|uniref:hypothetical protein n=1 Tax=Streptomyces sp. NPDC086989 TaxID=3365764 RepID=UPI00380B76DB
MLQKPVLQGCVIVADNPRGFVFTNSLRALTAVSAVLAPMWLCVYGHGIEVVGAMFAPLLIKAISNPAKQMAHALSKASRACLCGGDS